MRSPDPSSTPCRLSALYPVVRIPLSWLIRLRVLAWESRLFRPGVATLIGFALAGRSALMAHASQTDLGRARTLEGDRQGNMVRGDSLPVKSRARVSRRRKSREALPALDPSVVRGFTRGSVAYERARPEYPDQARDFVARTFHLGPGKTVVEIGGGTGKWTRQLVHTGAEVIVVEPLPAMRRQLRRAVPGVQVLARRGEETRLPPASVDLVTVAQAMHWLEGPRALEEFDRILRPGGGVAVIYNERRERGVRGQQLRELLDRYRPPRARRYMSGAWKWAFRQSQTFAPLSLFRYKNQQVLDRDAMLDRYRSISFVSALSPRRQRVFFRALARVLDEEVLRTGSDRYTLHYHGKIFWTRRREG